MTQPYSHIEQCLDVLDERNAEGFLHSDELAEILAKAYAELDEARERHE